MNISIKRIIISLSLFALILTGLACFQQDTKPKSRLLQTQDIKLVAIETQRQSIISLYQQYKHNVVIIQNEKDLVVASGVVVDKLKGLVVTANHVVDAFNTSNNKMVLVSYEGKKSYCSVVKVDASNDIALLKVDSDIFSAQTKSGINYDFNPSVGTKIFVIGHPQGIIYSLTIGNLSLIDYSTPKLWAGFPDKVYLGDYTSEVGNSGCPVYNYKGELIGINIGWIYSFKIIVPAKCINKLIIN